MSTTRIHGSLRIHIPTPEPLPWGEKLTPPARPAAVIPAVDKTVRDESVIVRHAQTAERVLESFETDCDRFDSRPFTVAEVRAAGGFRKFLGPMSVKRLADARANVEELERLVGSDALIALSYGPGGLEPDYQTVSSLRERLTGCEAKAAQYVELAK